MLNRTFWEKFDAKFNRLEIDYNDAGRYQESALRSCLEKMSSIEEKWQFFSSSISDYPTRLHRLIQSSQCQLTIISTLVKIQEYQQRVQETKEEKIDIVSVKPKLLDGVFAQLDTQGRTLLHEIATTFVSMFSPDIRKVVSDEVIQRVLPLRCQQGMSGLAAAAKIFSRDDRTFQNIIAQCNEEFINTSALELLRNPLNRNLMSELAYIATVQKHGFISYFSKLWDSTVNEILQRELNTPACSAIFEDHAISRVCKNQDYPIIGMIFLKFYMPRVHTAHAFENLFEENHRQILNELLQVLAEQGSVVEFLECSITYLEDCYKKMQAQKKVDTAYIYFIEAHIAKFACNEKQLARLQWLQASMYILLHETSEKSDLPSICKAVEIFSQIMDNIRIKDMPIKPKKMYVISGIHLFSMATLVTHPETQITLKLQGLKCLWKASIMGSKSARQFLTMQFYHGDRLVQSYQLRGAISNKQLFSSYQTNVSLLEKQLSLLLKEKSQQNEFSTHIANVLRSQPINTLYWSIFTKALQQLQTIQLANTPKGDVVHAWLQTVDRFISAPSHGHERNDYAINIYDELTVHLRKFGRPDARLFTANDYLISMRRIHHAVAQLRIYQERTKKYVSIAELSEMQQNNEHCHEHHRVARMLVGYTVSNRG